MTVSTSNQGGEANVKHTRLVSVRLLDTTGRWRRLAGCLGSKLLTRCLTTSGFTYDDHVSKMI